MEVRQARARVTLSQYHTVNHGATQQPGKSLANRGERGSHPCQPETQAGKAAQVNQITVFPPPYTHTQDPCVPPHTHIGPHVGNSHVPGCTFSATAPRYSVKHGLDASGAQAKLQDPLQKGSPITQTIA